MLQLPSDSKASFQRKYNLTICWISAGLFLKRSHRKYDIRRWQQRYSRDQFYYPLLYIDYRTTLGSEIPHMVVKDNNITIS